jgi:hypothetical protein
MTETGATSIGDNCDKGLHQKMNEVKSLMFQGVSSVKRSVAEYYGTHTGIILMRIRFRPRLLYFNLLYDLRYRKLLTVQLLT